MTEHLVHKNMKGKEARSKTIKELSQPVREYLNGRKKLTRRDILTMNLMVREHIA